MPDPTEAQDARRLATSITVAAAQIGAARKVTSDIPRETLVANSAPRVRMMETVRGRRKLEKAATQELQRLTSRAADLTTSAALLTQASRDVTNAAVAARTVDPFVTRMARRPEVRAAMLKAATPSNKAHVDQALRVTPTRVVTDLSRRLDDLWETLEQRRRLVVRREVLELLSLAVTAPVVAPLPWSSRQLPTELKKRGSVIASAKRSLLRTLSRPNSDPEPIAVAMAAECKEAWLALAPYARALDNWAQVKPTVRVFDAAHVALSLRTATVAREAVSGYAMGRLCSLTFADLGSDPSQSTWREIAALPQADGLSELSLSRVRFAGNVPTSTADGDVIRVTGAVAAVRRLQVNEGKQVYALVLAGPAEKLSVAVLPYFNPQPLGVIPGCVLQLSGTLRDDAMGEFTNRNTAKAVAALYETVHGNRRGIVISRFALNERADRDRDAAVVRLVRPTYDFAPSAIAAIWSLQPGLPDVIRTKSWFVEPSREARDAALGSSGGKG